jgi:hypothetical protein
MNAVVIVAELSRRKRSIPCADECVADCPFFQAQSLSECCGMAIGQASFASLDSADGGGAESGSVCDVFLRQSRKIPQVGDGPTVFRDDDEAVEGYSQLLGGPGEVVGLRVRSRGFPVVDGGRVDAYCAGKVAARDSSSSARVLEGLGLEAVQGRSHCDFPFIAGHPIEDVDTIVAYRV